MTFLAGAPGEPANTDEPRPDLAANLDQGTGTPADAIGTGLEDLDLDPSDPIAREFLRVFQQQEDDKGDKDEPAPGETDGDLTPQPSPTGQPSNPDAPDDEPVEAPPNTDPANRPVHPEREEPQRGGEPEPNLTDQPRPDPAQPEGVLVNGFYYTPEAIAAMREVYDFHASLTPAQIQQIDAILTQPAAPHGGPSSGSGAPQPADPDDEYIDPRLAQEVHGLQSRLDQLLALEERRAAEEAQKRQAMYLQAVEETSSAFKTEFGLDDTELATLQQRTAAKQIIPALAAQYPSDPGRAFREALTMTYWSDPEFRTKALERQQQLDAVQQDELRARRAKAAAVTGAGGSVSRKPPATPQTREGRQKAMVDELAAAINGN